MTTIRIEGAAELIARLTRIEQMQRVKASIRQAAVFLERKVKEYPTESHRPNWMLHGNSAKAQRMRRGFFYHLNHGDITVPYKRTQNISKKWTTATENSGWRAVVGNTASYARLVQDSAKQTSYHRHTGWITTRQVELLYGRQAINMVERALKSEVENG